MIYEVVHDAMNADHWEYTSTLVEADNAQDALNIYNEHARRPESKNWIKTTTIDKVQVAKFLTHSPAKYLTADGMIHQRGGKPNPKRSMLERIIDRMG